MSGVKITCARGHSHTTVTSAKSCGSPAPSATGGRRVVHTSEPPTDKQRAYIARMGGVIAPDATRLEASRIIEALIAASKATTPPERRTAMQQSRLGIPVPLIASLHDGGRFAVSLDGSDKLHFVRVSTIKPNKSGKFRAHVGHIKVQTQHSEDLIDRARIAPDGQVVKLSHTMTLDTVTQLLLAVIVDQQAAALKYGRAMKQCCCCGKKLTDSRSRWYGIGPECEKKWPAIIDKVTEEIGEWDPSMPDSTLVEV